LCWKKERITSIADLYPEAAARERELQRRFGLRFAPAAPEPSAER
jgi:Ni,Fe-hydrogenase III component G